MSEDLMATSDYTRLALRPMAINRLKNGNFNRTPRQYTVTDNYRHSAYGTAGITRTFRTRYKYDSQFVVGGETLQSRVTIPGFRVPDQRPPETFISDWFVWGAEGIVSFDERGRSMDDGARADLEFLAPGDVTFLQSIESFDKFRGKPVTLAVSGYQRNLDVKVQFIIDCGSKVIEGRPFYSRYFGPYTRMINVFESIPLDITKFDIMIKLSGDQGSSVGVSGIMMAIGAYHSDLPYSDNPSDVAVPSGAVILWLEDT